MLEQNMKNNIIQGSTVPEIPNPQVQSLVDLNQKHRNVLRKALVIWVTWLTLINS